MIDGLILIGVVLVVLLVLGAIATVRFFIALIAGPSRRREQERMEAMRTALDLRRLRDRGYLTPTVYEQVARAYSDWQHGVPPGEEVGGQRSEVGSQPATAGVRPLGAGVRQPEAGGQRSEVGGQKAAVGFRGLASDFRSPLSGSAPAPPPRQQLPPAPARPALLAAFLERRNIRWGELLGGLLILGCSAALVVSFWAKIADRPIFKFALFTCATAAFFGVGLYSEHRWKLPTTSRAILLLATLLVPVNLLAIAALGGSGHAGTNTLLAQLASLAIFTVLIWPAARVLVGSAAPLFTAGLSAASLALVAIAARPVGGPAALAAMPAGCLLVCSAIAIVRLWKMRSIGWSESMPAYLLHGVIGFAAWLAVGFVLFTAPHVETATAALSPIFTALGLPAFFLGLVMWKRSAPHDRRIGIAALSVAVFGTSILLAGLLAAWPGAQRMVPIGAFDALLLGATAIGFDLPAAYVPAAILASLAWLIGFHTWPMWHHGMIDGSQAIIAALGAGENGWLLLPMAMLLGLAGRAAARRPRHGLTLGVLALFTAAASVVLANVAVLARNIDTTLDPACFDLLVGSGFLVLWAAGRRRRWWHILGAVIPLLLAETLILGWNGRSTDALVERILPAMLMALCAIVPIAVGLIGWRGKRGISPGVLAGVGLLETVGIALTYRWNQPGHAGHALLILRTGHVISAWAVFGLGAWLRWRFDVPIAAEISEQPTDASDGAGGVLAYRSQAFNRHWRLPSLAAVGIVDQTVRWTMLTGVLAFVGCLMTDGRLMSGAAGMLALSMLAGGLACWADMPGLLFIAGVLLNFAGTFALLSPPLNRLLRISQLPEANVLFLAIGGGVALLLDRQVFARRPRVGGREVGFALWPSWASLFLLATLWTLQSMGIVGVMGRPDWVMWTALGAVAALFAARLSEPRVRDPIAGIYLAGIAGVAFGLAYVPRGWAEPATLWGMALGMYGLVTAAAGMGIGRLLGREDPRRRFLLDWLRICTAVLAATAMWGAANGDWNEPGQRVRIAAAMVALVQGIALGLLAEGEPIVQTLALSATAAGMVLIAWAMMPVKYLDRPLDVASAGIAALAAFAGGAAIAWRFVGESLRPAIRSVLMVAVGVAAAATVAVVIGEAADYVSGTAPLISRWAVIGIECGLLGGLAGAIAAAVGAWPISAAERSACVWAGEGLVALAYLHLRVTEPWMFNPRVEQYWPMILLAAAFCLLAGGYALKRTGRAEIGQPLEYSGLGLPMAVILGYWLHSTVVDYSAVLWIAGVLYAMAAALRRSPGFTLLAAACLNGAMWVVFARHPQTQFFIHPQLWLIPAALSVLAAAQIHRRQLGPEPMRGVRYLCLAVIYLSSTADIVLNGVTATPWLPMVLAGLAIIGVLAGILWHIRPFLYLGMTFLLIAVLTMIWTAQVNLHWTWLWYVAGLAAGVALFTLFGLFEKRHEQITRLVESLKQWQ